MALACRTPRSRERVGAEVFGASSMRSKKV
jgi:hypothetical protein